jgi:carboxyl-terminal processing protease
MSRWNLAWLLGVPAVVLLGLTLSHSAPHEQDYDLVRTVVEVLGEVDKNYVTELTEKQRKQLVENMINGGLEKLDPYSIFYNAEEMKSFEKTTEGKYGGVGIELGVDPNTAIPKVISPMVGTPAYDAGVLAGDLILKIDGKPTVKTDGGLPDKMRRDEAVSLITGEPNTPVTLTVLHEGAREPVDITIVRARIEVPTVLGDRRRPGDPREWEYFIDPTNRIAYVRIVQFSEPTARDLKAVLERLQGEGLRGLILDLRDNPGGLLTSAVDVSDLFLREGPIVTIRGRHDERTYHARPEGTLLEPAALHPMVVLINHNSASASEIVAAALQDHGRAVLIGERSYGKGSVQNVIGLGGGDKSAAALKLTTATYWRPSNKNIHRAPDAKPTDEWGVMPSVDPASAPTLAAGTVGLLLSPAGGPLAAAEAAMPGRLNSFDVPMHDVERFQFEVWRRQRDVVPGKAVQPIPGKPNGDRPARPFTDRVLERGVEYLRQRLEKTAAVPAGLPGSRRA